MNILIACEESQAVCIEMRRLGHNAYSCDILPCSGGHPEWHIQWDVRKILNWRRKHDPLQLVGSYWDLVISFPPCTHLSLSGAKHFERKRLSGEQEQAINFFLDVWEFSHGVENPRNIMSGWKYLNKWFPYIVERMKDIGFPNQPTQIIQPWQFGHGETKATCLWLKGIPRLEYTNIVEGREPRIWKMSPSENRGKERSKTYTGIAKAMAAQWAKPLINIS